jgi:poly-gamma-glutamate capsule biosynthesis protein CapA/YwtB (metallophosphatase superfamily)
MHDSPLRPVTLFLCGDVMLGRGVDQILIHSCPPRLHERYITSAADYVAIAERTNGPIPAPVGYGYVWGRALAELERVRPDARIINLETSITTSEDHAAKGIHYRMHPGNLPVLEAAGIDCCVLANNHVLDWGAAGLVETLATLAAGGIPVAGAGLDADAAWAPARLDVGAGRRVLVFGFGAMDSGIPLDWAARSGRPGVALLPGFSAATVEEIARRVSDVKQTGDIAVASIHWGGNWGYAILEEHRRFARDLIDRGGIDLVHGHSSHHPRAVEVHRGRLILYGCGDFLDDYEGIRGYESYRDDLVLMYFPTLDARTGRLIRLEMTPLRIRNMRLTRPSEDELEWLWETVDRESRRFGTGVERAGDSLVLDHDLEACEAGTATAD